MKVCSKCKEEKDLDCFTAAKRNTDGLCGQCKKCRYKVVLLWREKNIDSFKANKKKNDHLYRIRHIEQRHENGKKWRKKNNDKLKEGRKLYYLENKNIIDSKNKEYHKNNPHKKNEIANRAVKELSNYYIRTRLRDRGFTNEQINQYPELLESIKLIIKTKRLCKTSQN